MEYKAIPIKSLFEKQELKILKPDFDKRKDTSPYKTTEFSLPIINAKYGDNGIMFWGRPNDFESEELCIDVIQNGAIATGTVYAQPQRTGVLWDAYLIKLVDTMPTEPVLLYLATALEKVTKEKFSYDKKATWERVKEEKIILPVVADGTPDYAYMEQYISDLERERISDLERYLEVTGLENYELTEEDRFILQKEVAFKEYPLGKLLELKSPKKRFNANAVSVLSERTPQAHPYIVRTSENNGQKGYIEQDEKYLSPAKTFSFGQDTATVFFQTEAYFTGDKIKVMSLIDKSVSLSEEMACYFVTQIRRAFSTFLWGQSSFDEKILLNTNIVLPAISDDVPDYEYMEKYIRAQEKLAIRDVIALKNQIIEKTRRIVCPAQEQ